MPISPQTKADLGWEQLVAQLSRRARTARGEAAALSIGFFEDPRAAEQRIAEIAEARELMALEAPLPFGGIRDIASAVARAEKGGVLDHGELLAVADTAAGMTRLRAHLDSHADSAPRLAAIAADIANLRPLHQRIARCFDSRGELADHASEALGPLRRKLAQQQTQLERRMRSMVDDSRISPHLQDRYYTTREDRYVVPVRADAQGGVRGIIHGTSQSGQTVFIEPEEIVELGNRVKLAECEVYDEEQRILAELSTEVAGHGEPLRAGLEAATLLDLISANAELAKALDATAPTLSTDKRIHLERARHPLMELSERECVPNDLIMEPESILIISGPNAGGKTVALKTAGLTALMARAGMHIAADAGSVAPWFEHVYCAIGDAQSLERDLSTFSAHLVQLKEYLEHADRETLLLMDEISVGTEPEQGAALAQSVLEALAGRRVTAIVTTHYERLKALGAGGGRFANASVGFDLDTMEPTFQLHLGVPGSSGALVVARRMGVPADVVDRAESLLGERRASIEELLAEVADERRRLADERAELARTREEAERARRQAEVSREAAKDYERTLKQRAHTEAVAALRQARDELDRLRSDLKRQAKKGRLGEAKKRVAEISQAISEHAPARPTPRGVKATADNVQPGAAVYVASLGSRGQVVDAPQRGKITVQLGNIKTAVALDDVLVESEPAGNGQRRQRPKRPPRVSHQPAASEPRASVRTPEVTIDVRGERADEAVDSVDRFIDQCLLSMRDVVYIIHGHGTGALRSAIRSHLDAHHAVASWRPGERSEGGDGVTVASLDVD